MMASVDAPRGVPGSGLLKRSFDVVVASIVLVLTLPITLVAALAVKVSAPRSPVLVRETRVGKGGEHFDMLRFRTTTEPVTSTADTSNRGTGGAAPAGQQVTAVGRILRACSIDALPQWWNVLRGDMSVVGPSPAVPTDPGAPSGSDLPPRVPPGLTGTWRASAR